MQGVGEGYASPSSHPQRATGGGGRTLQNLLHAIKGLSLSILFLIIRMDIKVRQDSNRGGPSTELSLAYQQQKNYLLLKFSRESLCAEEAAGYASSSQHYAVTKSHNSGLSVPPVTVLIILI